MTNREILAGASVGGDVPPTVDLGGPIFTELGDVAGAVVEGSLPPRYSSPQEVVQATEPSRREAEEYEQELQRMGSDPSGQEEWIRAMRQLGRLK